ncbi:pyridoxal phosphate-dependent aminotransferase [Maridesulfovibrio hydrothermalis]|uniref:Hpt protein n=1 Tax=Maridesulfovibrio hydrothermalis AM13 = DSM 14728 TaxID=1121451 RepID=L0RFA7_9BACT|nr:histidinol-phosphate transaminase [Maridesulfovibrio hydrothermalis]CCO25414.1 Hpt protein [Maridesulfovibrio hydrothermalis AM13 = DSM 14728]
MTEELLELEDVALQGFVEQSLDKLDQIENELMKLEQSKVTSPAAVAQVYGILVSLKESAALIELRNISAVAGAIGNIFDRVFKNEIKLSSDLLNIIIDSFDKLNEMVSNATLSDDYDIRIVTLPLEEIAKNGVVQPVEEDEESTGQSAPAPVEEIAEEIPHAAEESVEAEIAAPQKTVKQSIPATRFRQKYGIKKEIDMASNANPLGVSKAVSNTIINMANNCCAFEGDAVSSLKFGLAQRHDIPEDSIIIANTAVELLDLALRLSAIPGVDHILSYEYGLPEYSSVAALCGVELLRLPRSRNFSPPLDQLVTTANENTAAVIITNPDIPSGYGLPAEELATMANLLPERTLLILDEKYVEFAWPEDDYSMINFLNKAPNLVILRSFSWSFGLRGVSLGYALTSPERVNFFEESRISNQVSPLNLGAGLAALNHNEFYYSTIALIIRGRERVQKGLSELGCTVYPSQGNFIMFSAPIPAMELHAKLYEFGFKVSSLEEFGLKDMLKVSISNNSNNRMFLAAMRNIL